jgi:hypothetical protein
LVHFSPVLVSRTKKIWQPWQRVDIGLSTDTVF